MRLALSALLLALAVAARGGAIPGNNLPLRVGVDSQGGSRFVGEIAVARLYDRALSAAEVARLAAMKPDDAVGLKGLVWQGRAARPDGAFPEVAPSARLSLARAMTAEAWVRPGALPPSGGRILDRITVGGADDWLLDTYPGASLRLIVGSQQLAADVRLQPGVWAHVAATVAPGGRLALYLDGKPVAGEAPAPPEEGVTFRGSAAGPREPLTLWYRQPATRWTEALALGNGRMGGMLYGGVRRERVALNDDTLWSGEPADTLNHDAYKYLPEVRRLLSEGKNRAAHDIVAAKMLGPFFQSYLPLGELTLDFPAPWVAEGYRRDLDLSTGVARVRYRSGGAVYTREAFFSHPAQAMVMRLACDRPGGVSLALGLSTQLHGAARVEGDQVVLSGRCPAYLDAYTGKPAQYEDGPGGRGMRFEIRARVLPDGGRLSADGAELRVDGADAVTIVLVDATSYNGFD